MSVQSPSHENESYDEDVPFSEDSLNTEEKCRLCLKGNDVLIPVQNGENPDSAVALKIDILTTVKVAPTDKICTVCRLKVKRFYSFRVMCLRSDARIRHATRDVSFFRPDSKIRSYKRVKRDPDDDSSMQVRSSNDTLSIIPMPHNENGNSVTVNNKVSSGLTISAVPIKREEEEEADAEADADAEAEAEADHMENGNKWDHDVSNGSEPAYDEATNQDDYVDSQDDETENLEVQIDPFMLMGDDTAEQSNYRDQQQSLVNSAINVRGQILYPVLGNIADMPPLLPGPHRPGPIGGKNSKDRERALELIKQMTAIRPKPINGSFQMTAVRTKTNSLDGSFLDKPFKCDVCPESFSYYKSFVKHKQRHTGELQPIKCNFCPDQFQTSRQLQNHLKHHNVEKAFPCDQCERSFPTKERLSSHYTLHTGKKPYVCEICNKSFAYKSSYGLHIRKQHGEQPIKSQSFKCDKCHQEFDIFVDFKRHLRTHAGEKPFTCCVCDKAFASKSILNVHSRIHNGLRPYKCEVCGQSFTQKQSLDYHMRRHNEENPFKCEVCGVTFQRRYFLEKHKETQHGVGSAGQGSDSMQGNSSMAGYEDGMDSSKHGDEDDDGDSDPLKLEIDETEVKLEGDEEPEDFPADMIE